MKANADIRTAAKSRGIRLWQIADKLGINDGNLSRKLRKELPQDEKQAIFKIIDTIAMQKEKAV